MSVSLSVSLEHNVVGMDECDIIGMASLVCACIESEERRTRAPLDLCCVLDRSGSMKGAKLDLVKAAMLFVIEQLKDEDRLSIVLFDTDVETALPISAMTATGRATARSVIERAREGSCTNLSGGLVQGLGVLKERAEARDVTSLLLFTDGLANVGLQSSEAIVKAAGKVLGEMGSCPIYTFGFGEDHDPQMLRSISEAANGLYYYLRKEDEIPQAFGECIGGLLSVAAQNVKVFVEVSGGCRVEESLSQYAVIGEVAEGGLGLSVGDLFSEERKDILFRLRVPRAESEEGECEIGVVRLAFFDAVAGKLVGANAGLAVKRSREPCSEAPNQKIGVQRNRLLCAAAVKEATALGEGGRLEEARGVIGRAIETIQSSLTGGDAFCEALVHDLQQAEKTLTSRAQFKSEGHRYMSNMYCTHGMQRCTENAWDSEMPQFSQQQYTTSHKMALRSKASK